MNHLPSPPQDRFVDAIDGCSYPVSVVTTELKGRCFVAKRDIMEGELVLQSRPYAVIPDQDTKDRMCARCMSVQKNHDVINASIKVTPCPTCNQIWYCCQVCREEDEPNHSQECSFLLNLFSSPAISQFDNYTIDYLWLLMRVLIRRRLERKAPSNDGLFFDDVWRLCSNKESFSVKKQTEFNSVARILLDFVHSLPSDDFESQPQHIKATHDTTTASTAVLSTQDSTLDPPTSMQNIDTLVQLICKEECNSFGLYTFLTNKVSKQAYGLALYPLAVFFNHSCNPNTIHTTVGRCQMFYASRAIKANEELTITYITLQSSTDARVLELENVFHFRCDCERCHALPAAEHQALNLMCSKEKCQGIFFPKQQDGLLDCKTGQSDAVISWHCESCSLERE